MVTVMILVSVIWVVEYTDDATGCKYHTSMEGLVNLEVSIAISRRLHFDIVHVNATSKGWDIINKFCDLIGKNSSISILLTNTTLFSNTAR